MTLSFKHTEDYSHIKQGLLYFFQFCCIVPLDSKYVLTSKGTLETFTSICQL